MIANVITLIRMPLLAIVAVLLYQPSGVWHLVAAGAIVVLILLDSVDGIVARSLGQTSVLGSVLDIAADRAVEQVMWIVYAHLGLLPVWVPLVVVVRGIFVDAIRAVAPARGLTPFELLHSRLGRFLVKSPWLRSPYGAVKALAFCLLAVQSGLEMMGAPNAHIVAIAAQIATWAAVALCLLRGLPVLVEGPRTLRELPERPTD